MLSPVGQLHVLAVLLAAFTSVHARTHAVPSSFATISQAMVEAQEGDTILAGDGTYRETIMLAPGVTVRAETIHGAILRGKGRDPVVTLASNSAIEGFVIERSSIGVLSRGRDNRIRACMIVRNEQSGIMCVGSLPLIEDNIVAFNGASGIQGRDVRSTNATIAHNTIAYNRGHGVGIGGASMVILEYNIIAFNEKADVFSTDGNAKAELQTNCLYRNGKSLASLPETNITADPQFVSARKLDFSLAEESACRRAAADNENLGARLR